MSKRRTKNNKLWYSLAQETEESNGIRKTKHFTEKGPILNKSDDQNLFWQSRWIVGRQKLPVDIFCSLFIITPISKMHHIIQFSKGVTIKQSTLLWLTFTQMFPVLQVKVIVSQESIIKHQNWWQRTQLTTTKYGISAQRLY